MKNFSLLFGVLCLAGIHEAFGQRSCGSTEYLIQQFEQDPAYKKRLSEIEEQTKSFQRNALNVTPQVYTIRVVFHIVYNVNSPEQNVSDEQIMTQLDILNKDFRRQNTDADNHWVQAADTEIQFALATEDPQGNPTTGITRHATNETSFSYAQDKVKQDGYGTAGWNPEQYLNIWVCKISGNILGYATFPGGTPWRDGAVITYTAFGTGGTATAPFDLGRTATHEIGHYFNLQHIWGDGGCGVDDEVADTPESDGPNYDCNVGAVHCGTEDMVANYMDYSDDACMNLFTAGQKSRMRALLAPGGAREGLLVNTEVTYRFVGPGTDWNNAANWQAGGVPPANYDGVIYIDSDCEKADGIEVIPPKQLMVQPAVYFQVTGN